jgi:hypothetical protein
MGANPSTLSLLPTLDYIGPVHNGLPHGYGRLIKRSIPQSAKFSWELHGDFVSGRLVRCRLEQHGLEYEGTLDGGACSGRGRLMNKKSREVFEGDVKNCVLVRGEAWKGGMWRCRGEFKENCENDKKSTTTNESDNIAKMYTL